METFARGALTFDVIDSGPADGEVVVLLHGFPQTPQSWDRVVPHLHEAGYRTLAPAQRGYSPGARPTGRKAYATDELVEDARALIEAAGVERAHVVGHDWGAAVAWGLAAAHPDRVASLTALSVPHTGAFLRAMTHGPQLPHSWYMLAFQVPGLAERFVGPGTPGGRARFTGVMRKAGMPGDSVQRSATVLSDPGAFTAAVNWYPRDPVRRPEGPEEEDHRADDVRVVGPGQLHHPRGRDRLRPVRRGAVPVRDPPRHRPLDPGEGRRPRQPDRRRAAAVCFSRLSPVRRGG